MKRNRPEGGRTGTTRCLLALGLLPLLLTACHQGRPVALEAGMGDAPLSAEVKPDGSPGDEGPPLDTKPPDAAPPSDADAGPCSLFSQFSCTVGSVHVVCSASCKTGTITRSIVCLGPTMNNSCICAKNADNMGTCSLSGSDCQACRNAFTCCASKF